MIRIRLLPTSLLSIFILLLSVNAKAVAVNDSCNNLTGTWYGTYTDAGKLFYEGGPWAVILDLHYQNGRFIGNVIGTQTIPPKSKYVWGECHQGQLTNIYFLDAPGACSPPSKGHLLQAQEMTINYDWENPNGMGSTSFNMHLTHTNNNVPSIKVGFLNDFLMGKNITVKNTCH